MDHNKDKKDISTNDKKNNNLHPLVSVITVCLNSGKDIEKTILSVINQTYSDLEYIIVDGASSDDTLDIIYKYDYEISRWISEPDEGIYDAMNKGIELSSGDWLIFINSGDYFIDDNIVAKIIKIYNKDKNNLNKTGLIYGNVLAVNEDFEINYRLGKKINGIKDFYYSFERQPICHQAVFFCRDLFKKVGFYDEKFILLGDYEWFIRFFSSNSEYITRFIDIDIVKFQMDGLSFKLLDKALAEKKSIVIKYFPPFESAIYYLLLPFIYLKFKILALVRGKKIFRIYRFFKYIIFKSFKIIKVKK